MLLVNIDTFELARRQLSDTSTRQQGIDTLKKMLEIKEAHLWRSEVIAPCCGTLGGFACQLNEEITLLKQAIALIERDDLKGASTYLDRLAVMISYGMGQKETPELIERLTSPPQHSLS